MIIRHNSMPFFATPPPAREFAGAVYRLGDSGPARSSEGDRGSASCDWPPKKNGCSVIDLRSNVGRRPSHLPEPRHQ